MAGIIKLTKGTTIEEENIPPTIDDFKTDEVGCNSIKISYIASDSNNKEADLSHYITVISNNETVINHVDITKSILKVNERYQYTINELKDNKSYKIQIFIKDKKDEAMSTILLVKTNKIVIYGVRVNKNNSNPNTCCTYIEDAVNMTTGTSTSIGKWREVYPFNKVELVGFKNGKETGEIKPENKKQYKNGQMVPRDVDVMSRIPKFYWKITTIPDGYEIRISQYKFEGSDCYAHKVNGIEQDNIYIGAYLGYEENGKLRSISDVLPKSNETIEYFRELAQANGNGYQQWNWNTLKALQILYLINYKNLDSSRALGAGAVNTNNKVSTGGTNNKWFNYGTPYNNSTQVCFLGIEDIWGNLSQWTDGIVLSSKEIFVTSDNKFLNFDSSSHNGYKSIGTINTENSGRIKDILCTNEGVFFPLLFGGTDTTYYCDYGNTYQGTVGTSGGYFTDNFSAGIFNFDIGFSIWFYANQIGARLCYLG